MFKLGRFCQDSSLFSQILWPLHNPDVIDLIFGDYSVVATTPTIVKEVNSTFLVKADIKRSISD